MHQLLHCRAERHNGSQAVWEQLSCPINKRKENSLFSSIIQGCTFYCCLSSPLWYYDSRQRDSDKWEVTWNFTLDSSDNHMLHTAKRSVPFVFCTQYSFGGKHWWTYPEAVWFCFKISLDEESKNIPCRLATNWQSYLLWHVNIEAQPKWNVTPHAAWVLIIDIFMKLLWKAWEIKT